MVAQSDGGLHMVGVCVSAVIMYIPILEGLQAVLSVALKCIFKGLHANILWFLNQHT